MKYLIYFISFIIINTNLTAENIENNLSNFIPENGVKATVNVLSYPENVLNIQNTFQKSISDKQEWWMNFVNEVSQTGGPMPYHSNFGISEEEYDLLSAAKLQLVKIGDVTLNITKNENIIGIKSDGIISDKISVSIDLNTSFVELNNGIVKSLNYLGDAHNDSYGNWYGYYGKNLSGDIDEGSKIDLRFGAGVMTDSNKGFLLVREKIVVELETIYFYDYTLIFNIE